MVNGLRFRSYWCKELKLLKKKVLEYFSNYFRCPFRKWEVKMDLNFKRLSEEEASRLELPFTMEEITDAIWSCDESKALRPKGLNLWLFKKCW